jgi:DNA modification methylase
VADIVELNRSVRCLNEARGDNWTAYHGDCCDVVAQLPDRSIDFSIYSPPFSGLYIYNDSEADLGNSADDAEFLLHYQYLVRELFRVMRPGRIVAVHCKDLVFYKNQRGTAGLRDFPGMLIRAHEEAGFMFHSRVTIWRCPVREMTKTKSHGLLYKQLRADSSFSRQGLPEYFVVFRKWANELDEADISPVTKTTNDYPLEWWQETASPVWMNTRETDVLNAKRDPLEERHICPMPLDIITRATCLWSNPGDVVLSPFAGIGSEGYIALKQKRRFVGVELKESYWRQAARHLTNAENSAASLFDDVFDQPATEPADGNLFG